MKQNKGNENLGTATAERRSKRVQLLPDRTKLMICDDVYKVDRLFFSPVSEEKWLNRMASFGYGFVERTMSGYIFEKDSFAANRYYSVGFTKVSSSADELSDITAADVKKRSEKGDAFITTYGTKIYYKTSRVNETSMVESDAVSVQRHAFNGLAFWFSILFLWLGLLCYNLVYWVRFNSMGVFAKFTDGNLHDYITKDHSLWDITFDISDFVGNYPNAPHISLFALLTLITLPFAAMYLDLYLSTRKHTCLIREKQWAKK